MAHQNQIVLKRLIYPSLTETTCTACGFSAAAPSNGVLSSPIMGGGGGGRGKGEGRERVRKI